LTVNFTLRLDEGMKRMLDEVAAKEQRTPVDTARVLLREALKARLGKRGHIPPSPPPCNKKNRP
jgi:hypothetical protein